jgi:hypothetical protein
VSGGKANLGLKQRYSWPSWRTVFVEALLHALQLVKGARRADARAIISVPKAQLWTALVRGAATFVGWRWARPRRTILASLQKPSSRLGLVGTCPA